MIYLDKISNQIQPELYHSLELASCIPMQTLNGDDLIQMQNNLPYSLNHQGSLRNRMFTFSINSQEKLQQVPTEIIVDIDNRKK